MGFVRRTWPDRAPLPVDGRSWDPPPTWRSDAWPLVRAADIRRHTGILDVTYQIEKTPAAVTLHFSDGTVRDGVLFLGAVSSFRLGPETVLDLMRERELWLPFRDEVRGFSVVRKSMVAHVRHSTADDGGEGFEHTMAVTFIFADNTTLTGVVALETPDGGVRVVDYMNGASGFVELRSGDDRYVVNTDLIREVIPGNDAAAARA